MSAVLALLLYERASAGRVISRTEANTFVIIWGCLVVAYVTARILKKRGMLGAG